MTTHTRSTKKHTPAHSQSNPNHDSSTNDTENSIMTTKTNHPNHTLAHVQSVNPSTPDAAASADATFAVAPPPDAVKPVIPVGWKPPLNTNFHAVRPKQLELVALPGALEELKQFTDYQTRLGTAAPAHQTVIQLFDAANQWSEMRAGSAAWDLYCAVHEGIVWTAVRRQLSRMKPSYAVAVQSDPALAEKLPQLTSLLDAKQAIAKKAVATRRANKAAEAEGKPAVHGNVGKRRSRAAAKAALARSEE